ncbi:hypothetical protein BUZ16_09660, partial [Staphylococcus haemolyticus]
MILNGMKIHFRKNILTNDINIFNTFLILVYILISIMALGISIIFNYGIVIILISFFLFQYNNPILINNLQNNLKTIHFSYNKLIFVRYLFFLFFKYNLFFPVYIFYFLILNIVEIVTFNWMNFLIVWFSLILSLLIFLTKAITKVYLKLLNYTLVILSVIDSIVNKENIIILCFLLFVIFCIYTWSNSNIIVKNFKSNYILKTRDKMNSPIIYTKLYIFRNKNKGILIGIAASILSVLIDYKLEMNLDYSFLILALYLLELELLTDTKYKNFSKTLAIYYVRVLNKKNNYTNYLYTIYFSSFILYALISTISGILGMLIISPWYVINIFYTLLILHTLSFFYYNGEKTIVRKKKKFNNIIIQYLM